ncbi:hypothetical protein [Paracoccus sp. SSK6]|uniref:hypothetical protein n=1 Tax=Paracoccus sp. SSK6 TaxID=3143131 RepID=UPI00321A988F
MHRYPLTDYEKHVVRETPEHDWGAERLTEAHDEKPLPIDMPAIDDIAPASEAVSVAVFRVVIGAGLLIALFVWVLS